MPTVHIENATLCYANETIFSDLNLCLPAGKWVALLGPSGIGKSSLLRFIANLPAKTSQMRGRVYADNAMAVQQQLAYMAQTDLLLPWLTVLQNALLGLKLRKHAKADYAAQSAIAETMLKAVGLNAVMHYFPHQLSGGMRQRVALVRTLMEDKPIILMDEPFSALDAITRHKLQALAATLLKDKTVLFITHDPAEAVRLADEIYIMHGKPATLTAAFTALPLTAPRDLADLQLVGLQQSLFDTLTNVVGNIS